MPKKKTPELDPKEQFKRFQEAAKEAGVDEAETERAFRDIASAPRPSRTKGATRQSKD